MFIGLNSELYIEDCVDRYGQIELHMMSNSDNTSIWIEKDQALEIVRQLIKVFDIKELNDRGLLDDTRTTTAQTA